MRLIFILFMTTTLGFIQGKLFSSADLIRAQCFPSADLVSAWQGLFELQPALEHHGLVFVQDNPDVIFCNNVSAEIFSKKVPIIILERKDAASLSIKHLFLLKDPRIKAIFKNPVLYPKELNNQPLGFNDSYHFGLLKEFNATIVLKETPQLTAYELNKIQCVVWNIKQSAFGYKGAPLKDYSIDYQASRPIDVFFAGSTIQGEKLTSSLSDNIYVWHRKKAVEALKKVTNIKKIVCGDRVFTYKDYIDLIKRSKIVVSPWGFGEWCYRDFEAILLGAVLLKPDTSFIKCIPNVYQNNKTYVPCSADFSDLATKIYTILEHYQDYMPMRRYAKQVMLKSWDFDKIARDFVENVRKALARS